jgi:hypothetical protein
MASLYNIFKVLVFNRYRTEMFGLLATISGVEVLKGHAQERKVVLLLL